MAFNDRWQCFVSFSLLSIVSATCTPPPIPIRIGNVTLSTNQIARGLNISVGSPPQPFAFLPQWPLNNSFVYGTSGFCGTGLTSAACTTFRGGSYNQIGSTTRGLAAADSYPIDSSSYPTCTWITDNVTLSSNVTLGNLPLGIPQADWGEQSYFPQMALGLGPNSTVLNALKSTGQIASRSWSIFWGRTGSSSSTQLDGNFIFGGYDRAKVTGRNFTRSLSSAKSSCSTQMLVTITDMILNFSNGTDASLFGSSAKSTVLAACIVPTYPVLMTIPATPYFANFQTLTNQSIQGRSLGVYFYGMLYAATGAGSIPYDGDLTFKLDSGMTVRIPNDQLVVPDLTIDRTTGAFIANASTPELVMNAIQQANSEDLPQLGRQFLTAAYLMVNQDANSFTLWQANPTSKTDIVAIDSTNAVVETFCTAAHAATPSSTTPASGGPAATASAPVPTSTSISKIGTGAIAGIAVACIAGIGALVGLLVWFLMKRRRGGESPGSTGSSFRFFKRQQILPSASTASYVPQDIYKSELSGSGVEIKHEADGVPVPRATQEKRQIPGDGYEYGHLGAQELP